MSLCAFRNLCQNDAGLQLDLGCRRSEMDQKIIRFHKPALTQGAAQQMLLDLRDRRFG